MSADYGLQVLTSAKGKKWQLPQKAFRPTTGFTSFETKQKSRAARAQMKAKEKEMKDEKEEERQVRLSQPHAIMFKAC